MNLSAIYGALEVTCSKLLAAGENNFAVSAMQIGMVQPAIVAQLAGSYSMAPIRSHGSQGLKSAQQGQQVNQNT